MPQQLTSLFLYVLPRPVYGTQNNDWLFKNWVDGTPPLGWHDTICFCTLPVILIVMQSISQKLLQPPPNPVRLLDLHPIFFFAMRSCLPSHCAFIYLLGILYLKQNLDDSAAASQAIIKYLPILFGFFALNVPSGLGVYWVTNTLFSTAATLLIKNQVNAEMAASGLSVPAPAAPAAKPPPATSFSSTVEVSDAELVQEVQSPLREVEGFASAPTGDTSGPFAATQGKKKKKKKGGKK